MATFIPVTYIESHGSRDGGSADVHRTYGGGIRIEASGTASVDGRSDGGAHGSRLVVASVPPGGLGTSSDRSRQHCFHATGFRFVSIYPQSGDVESMGRAFWAYLLGRDALYRWSAGHRGGRGQSLDPGLCHAPAGFAAVPRWN